MQYYMQVSTYILLLVLTPLLGTAYIPYCLLFSYHMNRLSNNDSFIVHKNALYIEFNFYININYIYFEY